MSIRTELIRAINEMDRLRAELRQTKRENRDLKEKLAQLEQGKPSESVSNGDRPKRTKAKKDDNADTISITKVNEGKHEI